MTCAYVDDIRSAILAKNVLDILVTMLSVDLRTTLFSVLRKLPQFEKQGTFLWITVCRVTINKLNVVRQKVDIISKGSNEPEKASITPRNLANLFGFKFKSKVPQGWAFTFRH